MARPLRISYPGAVYHVTARGNERRPIVRDDDDRRRFVGTVASMVEQYEVACHAWVLMDNHYHLVVETPHANLSSAIRHLNGVYSQRFNKRHERVGHLLQGRFGAILIEKETYLLEVCRYVVLNPVRAGLVADPGDWRWSSYRATAGDEARAPWLTVDWLLGHFGSHRRAAQAAYRGFVAAGIARAARPWTGLRVRGVLGSEAFVEAVRTRIGTVDDPEVLAIERRRQPREAEAPGAAKVIERVARGYGMAADDLLRPARRSDEPRQVALYAVRHVGRLPLRAIGKLFGLDHAAVCRRIQAVTRRLAEDPDFRARVEAGLDNNDKT